MVLLQRIAFGIHPSCKHRLGTSHVVTELGHYFRVLPQPLKILDFDVTSRLERAMERVLWVLVAGVRVIFMHLTKSWANCVLAGVILVLLL